jgi:hypothetical protein
MFRRIVTGLTLVVFVMLQGCTTMHYMPRDEYLSGSKSHQWIISGLTTLDGKRYKFETSSEHHAVLKDELVRAELEDGTQVRIPMSQVDIMYIEQFSSGKTIALGLGIVGGITLLLYILAIHSVSASPGS